MIVSLLQENLLRALVRTGRVLSSRPQLPVVQNVLLQTEAGRLRVVTTNMETTETAWVGAKVEKEGGLCVSSRFFTDLVLTLPAETVNLRVEGGGLSVRCEGFQATLPGLSVKEFPPVPETPAKRGERLEKDRVLSALGLVLFAAATDEGRPVLTGVRVKTEGKDTSFTATDGYRLSVKKMALGAGASFNMVVPARALSEVVKVSQEEKEARELTISKTDEGQLAFSVGDTEIVTRLIDGEYPNTDKIVPTSFTTRALFDRETLLRAVKSAAVFARDNANIIALAIENQTATVSASSAQTGKNQVEVSAKVDGDGGEIAFNSRFLLEFLSGFSEPELLFEMTGSLNPGVFRPVKDDSFLHIIMPVRVQG